MNKGTSGRLVLHVRS